MCIRDRYHDAALIGLEVRRGGAVLGLLVGGAVVFPEGYLKNAYAHTRAAGGLCIADEVQTGVGRTGKFLAFKHEAMDAPAVVILAKGLASGYPISATLFKEKLNTWPVGAHGTTFGGNPVSAAAAMVTLDLVEAGLMSNAGATGGYLIERMKEVAAEFPRLGDVRGRGAMTVLGLVAPDGSRAPNMELPPKIVAEAFRRGLLLIRAGLYSNCVRTLVPLSISDAELDEGLGVLEAAIGAVA